MLITKYDPFQDLKEINKRFYNLSSAFPKLDLDFESSISGFVPVVNTREGEFAYHVDVDLPGVEKDDIKVDVEDNVLKISGERNFKKEVKEEDYYKVETSFGKFQRNFTLPNNVDAENISASSKDGVLEVIVPKVDVKKSKKDIKKIKVK
ncbi:Hsp20/alpha crystallin family protein [Candidatus Sulfurimonas marisnigri]|uniref:Hsp20/alpha crystallin family protein n=1 Tax=Candidatus Sulfurimonas marisnigri TaxID=2740405 RepID=A0A7S7M0D6_9BACT|nr:Hsp20/alpha crystallin family protein [Candidatus Sulfurimonas marisnigri]QOY54736.1 Hsp20/alpha crystallin family protein [Candidatus Sulfurimonas marisnigri]